MEFGQSSEDQNAGYMNENESDLEFSDCDDSTGSSDNEENTKRAKSLTGSSAGEGSSEDEFEKQMASELDGMMTIMESKYRITGQKGLQSQVPAVSKGSPPQKDVHQGTSSQTGVEYYDDVYFSSGSSDEGDNGVESDRKPAISKEASHKEEKHRKLTNDELFYDPDLDDKDERWVNRQRMAYHNVKASKDFTKKPNEAVKDPDEDDILDGIDNSFQSSEISNIPKTDAVLSCPACMTTLCLDCQRLLRKLHLLTRHEVYKTQYRAMFVLNCSIMKDEVLKHKPKQKKRKKSQSQDIGKEFDVFNPVRCSSCNTEVGVYDKDEVFHFYNVLAGN